MSRTNRKYEVRPLSCDWALDIPLGDTTVVLYFNSRNNAELVKDILEWEDARPNEAIPYQPTLTPQNEPLTLEQLRSYRVETDLASWHPEICDRAADCITDLMARCDRLNEARERANEACAKWETLCYMAEQERDTYKAVLQNWHEEG